MQYWKASAPGALVMAAIWAAPAAAQPAPVGTSTREGTAPAASAATAKPVAAKGAKPTDANGDEILVTATKQAGASSVHKVPIAVTAFGQAVLENNHVTALSDLTKSVPNVFLNATETVNGVNNFSIRGMAVYDTIPSNTPTVGIFQDGIYIGASAASALTTFDNSSIEVLRGPQGLLFGRNVTAGAILVNTSAPSRQLTINAQAAIESGPSFTESLVVAGPLTGNGTLLGKIAAFRNDDEGYFRNLYDGKKFGKSHTTLVRGALAFNPDGRVRSTLRLEHGRVRGDGPASQNHGVYSYDSFDFSINEPGFARNDWDHAILDTRISTAFGQGEIVNIAGYRKVKSRGLFDADSTPRTLFHFGTDIRQHQWSDELRYSGTFGSLVPTVGLYYYADHLTYVENRKLAVTNLTGGGVQDSQTYAIFSNFDLHVTRQLTVTAGARYSVERKQAKVQGLVATATSPCSFLTGKCNGFDFRGSHSWSAFTPKIGMQWTPSAATNLYAYWTKGFRSGGYNLRQTNLLAPPGPYDQEVENSFELGLKQDFLARRIRLNVAIFENDYDNLQRAIFQANPTIGIAQTTINSADTRIRGIEGELYLNPTDRIHLGGHFGYLDNHFRKIFYHLSGPGPVTPSDYALELPFLSKWSYGLNASYSAPTPAGELSLQGSFEHRNRTPSNDANTGFLKAVNQLDASLLLRMRSGVSLSLFGKNLTNQVTTGLNNPLTFTPGETIAPLNKGRVLGAEIRIRL